MRNQIEKAILKVNTTIDKWNVFFVKLFSLNEFEKWGVVVLYIVLCLASWWSTNNKYIVLDLNVTQTSCWAFFQNCRSFQDLVLLNNHLSFRPVFFSFLLLCYSISFIFLLKKKYGLSVFLVFFVSMLSLFPIFITTNSYNDLIHHQDHYLFYSLLIFFFAKKDRLKLFVLFYSLTYFFASIPKFTSDHWLLGLLKLPIFNSTWMPILSNISTLSQVVLPFFLLFGNRWQRYASVLFFEIFHLYSIIIPNVQYSFFWVTIPMIYLLFVEFYERPTINMFRENVAVSVILFIFTFLSVFRLIIPGDDQITTEGSAYSLNMFNVGYATTIYYQDKDLNDKSEVIRFVGNYYAFLQTLQEKNCVDSTKRRLLVRAQTIYNTFEPINTDDYCSLRYNPFWHNSWIGDKLNYSEDPSKLTNTQFFFYTIKDELRFFYFLLYVFISLLIIKKLFDDK